jgi:hypothetical protein
VSSTVGAGISESTHLQSSSTYRFAFLVMFKTSVGSSGENYINPTIKGGYGIDIVKFDQYGISFSVGDFLLYVSAAILEVGAPLFSCIWAAHCRYPSLHPRICRPPG